MGRRRVEIGSRPVVMGPESRFKLDHLVELLGRQPLALLESAVEQVGPDGALPILPERGPAEVRATAKALNSLSSRLKRAMESRMRLVAAAGHDLRTPITRMRLRAEFVGDDEERARWLTDLDELERIADSAILLVREAQGSKSRRDRDYGRVGQGAGESAHA
jgi:signal transduction histidine kinase